MSASADARPGIAGETSESIGAWMTERGESSYRARQVAEAVWRRHARTEADLHPLPAALREAVAEAFSLDTLVTTEVRLADGGRTEKALHTLADGVLIESVLMHYPARAG